MQQPFFSNWKVLVGLIGLISLIKLLGLLGLISLIKLLGLIGLINPYLDSAFFIIHGNRKVM